MAAYVRLVFQSGTLEPMRGRAATAIVLIKDIVQMTLLQIALMSAGILIVAYLTYGRLLARLLQLNAKTPTPSYTERDDIDYIPTESKFCSASTSAPSPQRDLSSDRSSPACSLAGCRR